MIATITHNLEPVLKMHYGSEVLVADVIGRLAVLSVSGLIDYEHTLLVRCHAGVLPEHPHSTRVHILRFPGRFGEEKLQLLRRSALGSHDRLHAGQGGKRLVAVPGQQQPLQILAEASSLGEGSEQVIEAVCIIFQRTGSRRAGQTFAHLVTPPPPLKHGQLRLTNYRSAPSV
jgi:hypothetical protein